VALRSLWIASLVAFIVGIIPLGAHPQSSASPRPTGFPLVWRTVDEALVGLQETATLRRIHGVFQMRSDREGRRAYLVMSWREPLTGKSKAAQCGGQRYTGGSVRETRNAGEGWFGLAGDLSGTADLRILRRIAVYKGPPGPPICVEATGEILGTSGVLRDFRGTFKLADDSRLVLRSR
jgi:hypothetical protein